MKTSAILQTCCVALLSCALAARAQDTPGSTSQPAVGPVSSSSLPPRTDADIIPRDAVGTNQPKYPKEALKGKVQGAVVLRGVIAKDGTIRSLSTISGDPLLAKAAIEAVRKWRYAPYKLHDELIETQNTITLEFRIDDSGVATVTPLEGARTVYSEDPTPTPDMVPNGDLYAGPVSRVGNGVSPPRAVAAPSPSFNSPAGAKFQGTSTLQLIVGPDGRPYNIRVIKPLGMGLDQKAIEAVSHWKFQPAKMANRSQYSSTSRWSFICTRSV